jgi:cell division protein FtsL
MNAQLRQVACISLLALAVVVTAIACIYARHESRKQFTHLQSLITDRDNLEAEWGKLKIEQSTWSTHGRVEQLAREKMQMLNPVQKDVTVVRE